MYKTSIMNFTVGILSLLALVSIFDSYKLARAVPPSFLRDVGIFSVSPLQSAMNLPAFLRLSQLLMLINLFSSCIERSGTGH